MLSERRVAGKVHRCPYCAYSTFRKACMTKHIRTHTGEKPFTCPHCSYCASTKHTLINHIRIHTGEKPYSCSLCPYRASQRSTLMTHLLTHKKWKVDLICSYFSTREIHVNQVLHKTLLLCLLVSVQKTLVIWCGNHTNYNISSLVQSHAI